MQKEKDRWGRRRKQMEGGQELQQVKGGIG